MYSFLLLGSIREYHNSIKRLYYYKHFIFNLQLVFFFQFQRQTLYTLILLIALSRYIGVCLSGECPINIHSKK